jgi:hypothetical protein
VTLTAPASSNPMKNHGTLSSLGPTYPIGVAGVAHSRDLWPDNARIRRFTRLVTQMPESGATTNAAAAVSPLRFPVGGSRDLAPPASFSEGDRR